MMITQQAHSMEFKHSYRNMREETTLLLCQVQHCPAVNAAPARILAGVNDTSIAQRLRNGQTGK